jgi:hypothetical protein
MAKSRSSLIVRAKTPRVVLQRVVLWQRNHGKKNGWALEQDRETRDIVREAAAREPIFVPELCGVPSDCGEVIVK